MLLAVGVSVAATIATLPLIAFNFHQISILGVIATVIALPALPVILVTSASATIAGVIHPVAGQVLGWVAWVPLEYVIRVVHLSYWCLEVRYLYRSSVACWCGPTTGYWRCVC